MLHALRLSGPKSRVWRLSLVVIGVATLGLFGCDGSTTGETVGFERYDGFFAPGAGFDGRHVPRRPLGDL